MTKKFAKKRKSVFIFMAIILSLTIWVAWGNTALMTTEIVIASTHIPKSFSGFRIAQISDLHNTEFGEGNARLLSLLETTAPDIIAITGDVIDSRNTDIEAAIKFAQAAVEIAPTYYVTGNHEARVSAYDELRTGLETAGVAVLENERTEITRSGESIALLGIDDPSFVTDYLFGDSETVAGDVLTSLMEENDTYTVLLSHRPELFDMYCAKELDLVFSGHAHGGQFRLPFIGGLIAPNQGLFPKYDAGLYTQDTTNMVVSRGLGNSLFPFRVNNRPEIVVVELLTLPHS